MSWSILLRRASDRPRPGAGPGGRPGADRLRGRGAGVLRARRGQDGHEGGCGPGFYDAPSSSLLPAASRAQTHADRSMASALATPSFALKHRLKPPSIAARTGCYAAKRFRREATPASTRPRGVAGRGDGGLLTQASGKGRNHLGTCAWMPESRTPGPPTARMAPCFVLSPRGRCSVPWPVRRSMGRFPIRLPYSAARSRCRRPNTTAKVPLEPARRAIIAREPSACPMAKSPTPIRPAPVARIPTALAATVSPVSARSREVPAGADRPSPGTLGWRPAQGRPQPMSHAACDCAGPPKTQTTAVQEPSRAHQSW